MLRALRRRAGNCLRRLSTWLVQGKQFRRYAPQSAPAAQGERLRIAVPYLIPNLGDTVMLFPLLDALRAAHPDAELSCFTHGGSRILGLHPAVDQHFELQRHSDWREIFGIAAYIHDLYRQWKLQFRAFRFHDVLLLRGGVDPLHSAHLGWMLGGNSRTGYSSNVEPERAGYSLQPEPLLTRCIPAIHRVHETERGSEVLEAAGLLTTPVDIRKPVASMLAIAGSDTAQAFLARQPQLRQPYAVVAPGSSFARRRWDWQRFAAVAAACIAPRGWTIVLVGGPEDRELCNHIAAQFSGAEILNFAGQTTFVELTGVCAGAELFVGNDSGTGHVAGACGVPTVVVAMFRRDGPVTHHSSPQRTHPLGPYVRVVQPSQQTAPCVEECDMDHAHCILGVEVSDVCEAVQEVLTQAARKEELW